MARQADTRDRILRAAMELFWAKGYNPTTTAEIAAAARVNPGSLYYFFPSKRDLLLAVLDSYVEELWPQLLEPAWAGVDDPIDRIFALLAQYRAALESTGYSYGCPIGSLALELHDPDPVVRERIADNFTGWTDAVYACLLQAGEQLPPDVDRLGLATFILTVMEGGVMQARTYRSIEPFDAAVEQLRNYIDALRARVAAG